MRISDGRPISTACSMPRPWPVSISTVGGEITGRAEDLIGLPACTVRAGFDALGVPAAVQLTGPAWSEWWILSAAQTLYDATADAQARLPDLALGG